MVKYPKDDNLFGYFDKDGKAIASVSKDGKVKDLDDKIIYTLSAPDANGYCTVYDANGVEFGKVHEKHKQSGACMMHASKKK